MMQIPVNTNLVSTIVVAGTGCNAQVLLLKRSVEQYWCQIAGKIEQGELAWQAILRELYEETGIVASELYNADYLEQFYEPHSNQIMIIPAFVVLLPNRERVRLNHEHTDYGWCSFDEATIRLPFPNQRKLLEHVWHNFVLCPPSQPLQIDLPSPEACN